MAQNGPKWSKTAQNGPKRPNMAELPNYVGKNTFRMSTAQNGQKQPKAARTAQSGPRFPSIMSAPWQKWPNLFPCQAHLKKNTTMSILLLCKVNLLDSKTNKQTKHQDLSEKIHQYYIENTYFCFRRNANKKTLSDKDCFLSLCWACFSINYIFCDFKWS